MQPATPSRSILVEGVSVRFGRGTRRAPAVDALVDLDLVCGAGEIVGVLGPNGSGKTTLFRVLCGELAPRTGVARVLGLRPGDRQLVTRVGFQPDGPVPFPHLRTADLLHHLGALMELPRARVRERSGALLVAVGLAHAARRRVGALSTGMQRRLALAAALLADPEVLLLDEPTSGLDPLGSRIVLEVLGERARAGTTVLLASHRLDEVEAICTRVVVLHGGRKRAEGALDDLLGTDSEGLDLRAPSPQTKAAVEAAARASGATVLGWTRTRRHPFELFRELEEEPH